MIRRRSIAFLIGTHLLAGCAADAPVERPNILLIVWDTVRADRLSLYGHEVETTPALDRWARSGRIFDATSTSAWTIPTHASMFTGLYPSQHGVNNDSTRLGEKQQTLAQLLTENGYQTYAFSSNPYVSERTRLTRGFEIVEHPFDPEREQTAAELVMPRLLAARKSLYLSARGAVKAKWGLSAVGEMVNDGFFGFLDERNGEQPFFAYLNFMEAHQARIPDRETRARVMSDAELEGSFVVNQSKNRLRWASFGLVDPLTALEQEIVGGVYDATLLQLDAHLGELLTRLESDGLLDETVVILTADHGEHLGEHGSYLHTYSLYEALTRVPLVVWAPGRLEPGRERLPVMNIDIFPTVLEMAGLEPPPGTSQASLLEPLRDRTLVSE
jgi:arylsulfatase A-like enzyme